MTLWTVARQALQPMETPWSGLPGPPPGDLPNTEIEPQSLKSPALTGGFFAPVPPGKPFLFSTPHLIPDLPHPQAHDIHKTSMR